MSIIDSYFFRIDEIMKQTFECEKANMEQAAEVIASANESGNSIFAFGCNHAGLLALELFYRTGGMVTVNPIRAPGMMLEVSPITMSSELERIPDYGRVILNGQQCRKGDVIIIHSVSGRNSVTVDMAIAAKEKGMTVIVLTNMNTAGNVSSRHPSGKMLHDLADILIDNHGDLGDATVALPNFNQRLASSSTVVGAAILNAITARASELLWEKGIEPPVFMSGNIDGGDKYNRAVIEKHKNNIFYM